MRMIVAAAACVIFVGGAVAQTAPPKAGMDMKDMDQKGSGSGMMGKGMDMKMMMPDPSDPAPTAGYKAAMMKMMMGMPKFTGDADIDFMMQMKPHHQAAIDMAKIVLANGKNAETKQLAQEIVAAQEKEIATIDAWLKKNGK